MYVYYDVNLRRLKAGIHSSGRPCSMEYASTVLIYYFRLLPLATMPTAKYLVQPLFFAIYNFKFLQLIRNQLPSYVTSQ